MSRTWRNRHAVPKGFKVRDGKGWCAYDSNNIEYAFDSYTHNHVYYRYMYFQYDNDPLSAWKKAYFWRKKVPCVRRYLKKFRKGYYSKELKEYRKLDYKRYRAKVKNLMRHERWEDIPRHTKTCGWNSW